MTSIAPARPSGTPDLPAEPSSPGFDRYLAAARAWGGRVAPLLAALRAIEPQTLLPLPGGGSTDERFRGLARIAEADLTAARVLEPHVDAVAIMAEAGRNDLSAAKGTTWGVFAAEAPGAAVQAVEDGGRWLLSGRKAWCSLGGELSHGLVTATTLDGEARMFAVELTPPAVRAEPAAWVARGLPEVVSGPLRFDRASATPIGGAAWYLDRPGFRWGAIGVAACWWGGCLPIASALRERVRARPQDALGAARLGELHRALEAGRLAVRDAAARIDAAAAGRADDAPDLAALAHSVRGIVADAVVVALAAAREVLGPAALAFDEGLARRCADLELYVSQYHRGRDDASLAAHLGDGDLAW
ncbi:dehydrogenase [Leifsonia sp. LS1]|uniref:hypothetical protein n=1 Tax=Leifsonia sp. LS1 TaxID=2828483 RepID=UPI001CFE98F4|nr:hypothetical protein [Leifsonia sp. LS1]GIT78713.1 dehydrogenase [Leifsonia sp. LS1]